MQRSESIGKLAEALAAAQGEIKGAVKDSENPFFKSKYADLASVRDACQGPLSKNNLAVIQTPRTNIMENVTIISVETLLAHSSGEWISEELSAVPVKEDPQGIGSCITYLRRYALAAVAGVAPEDDDGNAGSGISGNKATTKAPPRPTSKDVEITQLKKAVVDTCQMLNKAGDTPPWTAKRVDEFAVKEFGVKADALELEPLRDLVKRLSLKLDEVKKGRNTPTPPDPEASAKAAKIAEIRGRGSENLIAEALKELKFEGQLESLSLDSLIAVDDYLAIPF